MAKTCETCRKEMTGIFREEDKYCSSQCHKVAEGKKAMKKLFTLGNTKLPQRWAIWNLPSQITCVGADAVGCKDSCYAARPERFRPNVLPSRMAKLAFSKTANFIPSAKAELRDLWNRNKIDVVRIHESGDFYSVRYVQQWVRIIRSLRDTNIIFLAYTKSHLSGDPAMVEALEELGKCANVRLYYSSWEGLGKQMNQPTADAGKLNLFGYKECPGSCKETGCRHCVSGKSVFFPLH